ncbi:MAG TPA: glycosyltransferase family protein [Flavitalea sp.]|nr:glycosyltransferase family protein [Flavitalea sp.]
MFPIQSSNEKNRTSITSLPKHISTVLIAPLDWGLGHTTRCIPIIKEFKDRNVNVIVACNDEQKRFLTREFSDLKSVFLPGYDITYSINKLGTTFKIFIQSAKILTAIKRENRNLGQILHDFSVDLVIADNRYGFYHPSVYSILITHQLSIKSGLGSITDRYIREKLSSYTQRFNETWIPDNDKAPVLAGSLSSPHKIADNQFYIGPLSRLQHCVEPSQKHILVVLSGPEPQRSILERAILQSCNNVEEQIVLVRGSSKPLTLESRHGLVVHDFADTALLNQLICEAGIIISRSGYTSVMDILKLKKRWIVIATPGQAEQEYLAGYLHENGWAMSVKQNGFNLPIALDRAARFDFKHPSIDTGKFKKTIDRLLSV